ncbi:tetraspanin-18-like [Pristis pectinata]|uniref:tetraspanin-18-like n=1 Tax=Pristis pectinata TaxID=685728 RepID=UPI00223E2153|nr:tetraspanin-18-like [Pristis pectinata]XP_051885378.1 tetraspanin-18-like [Pristis pectinata]XP_051885379.1 tetraspanin-18-like [Pristis pectinata]XP_051885380.1 tetraspanin-18-like [Pristis pectinata]
MTVKMGRFERMRNVTIAFSVLISLSGCALLAIACLLLLYPAGPGDIISISNVIFIGTIYAIASSIVLLILGVLGSIAAFRESRCLLMVCFLLILLMCMVELTAGIAAFLFRNHLTKKYFEDDLANFYTGDNGTNTYTKSSNSIMTRFNCCGVNGPNDFHSAVNFVLLNPAYEVPEACCKRHKAAKSEDVLNIQECTTAESKFINSQGCFDLLAPKMEQILYLTGGLSIWILIIEICVMIFAIWLFQRA